MMKQQGMILQRIKNVFEKPINCDTFYTDNKQTSIDIVSCINSPFKGVTSYSTLGVYTCENWITADNKELRVEFVGVSDCRNNWFAGLLSTCAFAMLNGKVRAQPYEVYRNIISIYQPNIEMKHLLLVPPFSLNKDFHVVEMDNIVVTWLMLNPISDNELNYMHKHGLEKLMDAFIEADIDVYNLYRKSIF